MPRQNEYKQIAVGTRFSKITVGEFFGFDDRRRALFNCTCDCGTVKTIAGSFLRNGDVKSCGCLPVERMRGLSASLAIDETGKRYGKLTVIRRVDKKTASGSFVYECRCDCGALTLVRSDHLRNGMRTTCKAWACRDDFASVITEISNPSPDPMKDSYFAGHFDGEGCLSFQGENYFPHITARVSVCYKPTLLEYKDAFGGQVKRVSADPRRSMGRVQWLWQVSAQHEVYRFVHRLLPYVTEKRAQFELAKDYLDCRAKVEKYNAGPEFVLQIPVIKARMSDLKKFEFKN